MPERRPPEGRRPRPTASAGPALPAMPARRPGRTARRRLRRSLRAPTAPRPVRGQHESRPARTSGARWPTTTSPPPSAAAPRCRSAGPARCPARRPRAQDPDTARWSPSPTIPPPGTATPPLSWAVTPAPVRASGRREGASPQRAGQHGAGYRCRRPRRSSSASGSRRRALHRPRRARAPGPGPGCASASTTTLKVWLPAGATQHPPAAAAVQVGPAARVEARHRAFRRRPDLVRPAEAVTQGPPGESDPGHEPGAGRGEPHALQAASTCPPRATASFGYSGILPPVKERS